MASAASRVLVLEREPEAPASKRAADLIQSRQGAALTLEGVSKSFGGVKAIEAVDLDVMRGEICGVIGPNGAGKSTLINLMSGIYAPDAGSVVLGTNHRHVVRARDLARLGVARTFQNLALFGGLTVAENIAIGMRAARRSTVFEQIVGLNRTRDERANVDRHVEGVLDFLQLADLRHRDIASLPYGVRKRIELGRAIVTAPRLLLLDEPLAGVSGADKAEMVRLMRVTHETFGTTIVIIEHDVGVVMDLADHIAVLDHGRKIADGTPDAVRRDPAVIAAYLGEDYEAPST